MASEEYFPGSKILITLYLTNPEMNQTILSSTRRTIIIIILTTVTGGLMNYVKMISGKSIYIKAVFIANTMQESTA